MISKRCNDRIQIARIGINSCSVSLSSYPAQFHSKHDITCSLRGNTATSYNSMSRGMRSGSVKSSVCLDQSFKTLTAYKQTRESFIDGKSVFRFNVTHITLKEIYKTVACQRCHFSNAPKNPPNDMKAYIASTAETLSKTLSTVLTTSNEASKVAIANVKGTLLELLAKRLPEKEKSFLAEKWGFVNQKDMSADSLQKSDRLNSATSPSQHEADIQAKPKETNGIDSIAVEEDKNLSFKITEEMANKQTLVPMSTIPEIVKEETKETPFSPMIEHPIFGQLIADLPYKQVYLTNVSTIAKAPVWQKNRTLRSERVEKIAKSKLTLSKLNARDHPHLSGVITFYHISSTGEYGIVDGQHRGASLVYLSSYGHWDADVRNVVIDVFTIKSEEEISDLFKEINSSEPVRLVDMPDEGASDNIRQVITEAAEILQTKYSEMFKPSARCRPPHLNIDNLRDDLFQNDIIKRHNIKTSKALVTYLEDVNDKLSKISDKHWLGKEATKSGISYNVSEVALKKARSYNFYLGLEKTWLTM